jgi:hypothetical protein
LMGRAQHDANEHMAARRALARAMHMFPTDLKLRFNMAFVLQVGRGLGACLCVRRGMLGFCVALHMALAQPNSSHT